MDHFGDRLYFDSTKEIDRSALSSLRSCLKWLVYSNEDVKGERELYSRLNHADKTSEDIGGLVGFGRFEMDVSEANIAVQAARRCEPYQVRAGNFDFASPRPADMLVILSELQKFVSSQRVNNVRPLN